MAKVYFSTAVKYNGTKYPANTPFEVNDADIENLKKAGGWVIPSELKTSSEEDISKTSESETSKEAVPETVEKKGRKAKVKEAE